jgi:hypothetical protein
VSGLKQSYQKLRLQEFNDFDVERLLKGVVDTLEEENDGRLAFIEANMDVVDNETLTTFANEVENNSAEMIRVTSILTHTDDIYMYFANGPLFRKDRDVE